MKLIAIIGLAFGIFFAMLPNIQELGISISHIQIFPETIQRSKKFSLQLAEYSQPFTQIMIESWSIALLKFDELIPSIFMTETLVMNTNPDCYEGLSGSTWWTYDLRGLWKLVRITTRVEWPLTNIVRQMSWNSTMQHPLQPASYPLHPQIHSVENCVKSAAQPTRCDLHFNVFPYGRTCWKFSYEGQNEKENRKKPDVQATFGITGVNTHSLIYLIVGLMMHVFGNRLYLGLICNILFYPLVIIIFNPLIWNILVGMVVGTVIKIFNAGTMIHIDPINIDWSWIIDWLPLYLMVGSIITCLQIILTKNGSRQCILSLRIFSFGLIVYSVQIPSYGIIIYLLFVFIMYCFSLVGSSDRSSSSKKTDRYKKINEEATKQGLDELRKTLKAMKTDELMKYFGGSKTTLSDVYDFIDGKNDSFPRPSNGSPVDHNADAGVPPEAVGDGWRQKLL